MPVKRDVACGPARPYPGALSRKGLTLADVPSDTPCQACGRRLGIHDGTTPQVTLLIHTARCTGFVDPRSAPR